MSQRTLCVYQARRKSRETTGQPHYDMSIFNSPRYPRLLPDALRPKPGGLHPQQLQVYEAFQRAPRQPGTVPRSPSGPQGSSGPSPAPPGTGGSIPPPASPAGPAVGNVPPPTSGQAGSTAGVSRGVVPKVVELTMDQALSAWEGAIGRLDSAIGSLLTAHRRAGGQELTLLSTRRDQEVSASLQEVGVSCVSFRLYVACVQRECVMRVFLPCVCCSFLFFPLFFFVIFSFSFFLSCVSVSPLLSLFRAAFGSLCFVFVFLNT